MIGEADYFKGETGTEALFHHLIGDKVGKSDYIVIAYIYPYTFRDMAYSLFEIDRKVAKHN